QLETCERKRGPAISRNSRSAHRASDVDYEAPEPQIRSTAVPNGVAGHLTDFRGARTLSKLSSGGRRRADVRRVGVVHRVERADRDSALANRTIHDQFI